MKGSLCCWAAWAGFMAGLAGCTHLGERHTPCPSCQPAPPPALLEVQRGNLEPIIQGLTVTALPDQGGAATYQRVTDTACQCLAAAAPSVANALDREREEICRKDAERCIGPAARTRELDALKETLLLYSALETRNQWAGSALDLYYRLVEAEAKGSLAGNGLHEMGGALARSEDLRKKGFKLPVEYDKLVRQQTDLKTDRTTAEVAIDQLNGQLGGLLGLDGCPKDGRIWPAAALHVGEPLPCADDAVAVGMAQRPELILLREVSRRLEAATLPAADQLLKSVNSLVGLAEKPPCCPCLAELAAAVGLNCHNQTDLETRRQQLEDYRAERERAVARDIRTDVQVLRRRTELVALARAKAQSWQKQVEDLEEKNARGLVSFMDVTSARLEWFRARGDVVKEVADWERARAKLRQDQGLLVWECGYQPVCCCGAKAACAARGLVTAVENKPGTTLP